MTHSGHSSDDRVAGIATLWPVRGRSVGGFLGDQLFDFRLPLKCRISLVIRRVGIFLMRCYTHVEEAAPDAAYKKGLPLP